MQCVSLIVLSVFEQQWRTVAQRNALYQAFTQTIHAIELINYGASTGFCDHMISKT